MSTYTIAENLLTCVTERLTTAVERAFVAPAGPPAWDFCGTGMAWVQISSINLTNQFPSPAAPLNCVPAEQAITLNAGVLRCTPVVRDGPKIPTPAELSANAALIQTDARELLDAVFCCFKNQVDQIQVGAWTPLGPNGGYAGGVLSVLVADAFCPCTEVD